MRRIGGPADFALVLLLVLAACLPAGSPTAIVAIPTAAWTATVLPAAQPTETELPASPTAAPTSIPEPTAAPTGEPQAGATATTPATVEVPAAGARVTLPLHILARVGRPGEQVVASLRWQEGTELTQTLTTIEGEDGRGLLIDSINWPGESQPPEPPTQAATLYLLEPDGSELARQEVTVLSPGDPDTQVITLYFLLGEELQATQRRIPKTAGIGTAALEELLWGPAAPNLAGFGTAIPTPQEVLSYPGRTPAWGPRVTLRSLTIVDGVATADFSGEMRAYGGGSLRVMLLGQQIGQTLKQFPTVRDVVLAVEGQTEGEFQP